MKTQKSTEINELLTQTTSRLNELYDTQSDFDDEVANLQDEFTNGTTSFEQMQAGQAKLSVLRDSIKALEAKEGGLKTAYAEAFVNENQQDLQQSAKAAALQAEKLFNESLKIRNEANDLIGECAEKFQEKFTAYQTVKKEYKNLCAQSGGKIPGISDEVTNLPFLVR